MPYAHHVYHIYAVRAKGRQQVMDALAEKGISCGVHYPVPIHLQRAYANKNLGNFPVAERTAEELISLPMFPELTREQITYVSEEIKKQVGKRA